MKITLLGTGTCSTIPNISDRKPPAFLVEWDGNAILFDCSEGVRFRLEQIGFDISRIRHIAISHTHPDHYSLPHFHQSVSNRWAWGGEQFKNEQISVYAPAWAADNYTELWNFYSPDFPNDQLPTKLHFIRMPESGSIHIGSGKLTAFPVHHGWGTIQSLAFRLETPEGIFAYSGDTGDCPGIREACRNADVFVCEASARIGDIKTVKEYGHLHPEAIGDICRNGGVKHVILFHYTGLDSDNSMEQTLLKTGFSGKTTIGKDFQTFLTENIT
jgi:ribonuclease Z